LTLTLTAPAAVTCPATANAISRTNHASNYLPLSGRLPRDREQILEVLDAALEDKFPLKPDWARGL
jgi:hypothetical protein